MIGNRPRAEVGARQVPGELMCSQVRERYCFVLSAELI